MLTAHTAPVVLPLTGPPVRDGAVVVDGDRIVAVGPATEVVPASGRVRAHRGVLLPGLVDASVRLEDGQPGRPAQAEGPLVAARAALHALLRSGTTCVGDVAASAAGVRAAGLVSVRLSPACLLVSGSDRDPAGVPADATVVLTTRADAARGAPPAPVAALLAAGVRLALGTGPGGPDLDLLAEARAAYALAVAQGAPAPGLAERLVRAASVDGAAALGVQAGVLAPGARADLAVLDVPAGEDPYACVVLAGAGTCTATVVAGRLVHRC